MLYIFDNTEKLITTLPKGSFFDAVHREVLNGENTFEFSVPAGHEKPEFSGWQEEIAQTVLHYIGSLYISRWLAQGFKPTGGLVGANKIRGQVRSYGKSGTPPDTHWYIYNDNGGKPGTSITSKYGVVTGEEWPTSTAEWATAEIELEESLQDGQQYWLVLSAQGEYNTSNLVKYLYTDVDVYPDGCMATSTNGATWSTSNRDITFKLDAPVYSVQESAQYIQEGNLIAFKDLDNYWQIFEIKRLVDTHGDGLTRTAYCEHIFYELLDDIVTDKRPSAGATAALAGMLEGTRWQVGIVDDLGASSTSAYYESALSAVQKVANAWKGELNWRCVISGGVITRYVDLLAMRGTDTGKQFAYSKDILSIEREVDTSGVVTALYGRGKGIELDSGSYGRRLTFADVEAPGKPLGQEWIGDNDALARWGRPGGRHRFDVFIDEEETDPVKLLEKTKAELDRRKVPRVTYRLDVVSLEELTGYEHEKVRLGDLVRVIDREFKPELVVSARVIELERDLLAPENTKVVLGSFAPTIVEATVNINRRVNEMANRPFNTKWLDGKISVLQNEIENVQSYVFQTAEDGILVLDAPTYDQATKAMKLGGGMFAIANQKDGNGGWNWRTFGDGSGFTADLITAGMIDAGLIQIGPETTFAPGYDPSQIEGASAVGMGVDADCLGLWHFDGTLNSHKGVSATFTRASVAYLEDGTEVEAGQPRFEDGKFGKGVLIEEGTTNLISNPDFEGGTDGWILSAAAARSNADSYIGSYSLALTNPAWPQESTYNITGIAPSTAYTFSVYVKSSLSFIRINVVDLNGTTALNLDVRNVSIHSEENNNTWKRYTLTWTTAANADGVQIRIICGESGNSGVAYLDGFQLEQKPYATSFVIGTRDNEVLKVPANVFNKGNWTINLKYKAHQGIDDTWFRVLWECFIDSGNWYQLSFANSAGAGQLLLRVTYDGNDAVVGSDVILSAGTTYDITATGDGENLKLYVDGAQVGLTTPYAEPVGNLLDYMHIGGQPAFYANGIIDELRIDKIARTDEEIAGWYKANAPFYTSEDMKQWPGYMKLETDGLKVYDPSDALRVLVGSWLKDAVRKYGIKIIDGEIYSSLIRSGAEDADTYIQFKPPNNLEVYYGGYLQMIIEAVSGGRITFYNNGTMIGRLSGAYSGADLGLLGMGTGKVTIVDNLYVSGTITAGGSKPAQQVTENYGLRYLYAIESPEILYFDRYVGRLENGEAVIKLDPIFLECIEPDTELTPWSFRTEGYGENDIYVAEWGKDWVRVKERNGGTSNNKFVLWIEAVRRNYAGIRLMEVTN